MSLGLLKATDQKAYFEGATHIHAVTPGNTPTNWQGGTTGITTPENDAIYYDRLDRMMGHTAPLGGFLAYIFWDPLVVNNTPSASGLVLNNGVGTEAIWVGEWDKAGNVQRIYAGIIDADLTRPITELSPIDWSVLSADIFPNCGIRASRSGSNPGDPGHYRQTTAGGGGWQMFESYQGGRALKGCTDVWDSGGVERNCTLADIDLSTGLATPVLDVVQRYTAAPAAHHGPPFAGDSFDLVHMQFVPDGDSLPGAPKGRLFFFSNDVAGIAANERFQYVAIYDWNPAGVSGGVPSRVHKRLRILTRIALLQLTAVTSNGIGAAQTVGDIKPVFHPPTGTIRYFFANGGPSGTETSMGADETNELVYTSVPVLSFLTPPTALTQPRTNGRVDFQVELQGDLGEPIGGVDVQFTLRRVSTNEENLGTSDGLLGATAGDFSLTNVPVDDLTDVRNVWSGPTTGKENVWTPVLVNTGSGNEAEVNLTNGDLRFFVNGVATDLPSGDFVLADYNHFSVPVTPSHGTLLTLSARSDENGVVAAQVRYADDPTLENEWDELTATTV